MSSLARICHVLANVSVCEIFAAPSMCSTHEIEDVLDHLRGKDSEVPALYGHHSGAISKSMSG
jgi:hypothetical protein